MRQGCGCYFGFPCSWAVNDGMYGAQFSALWGWPTVSGRYRDSPLSISTSDRHSLLHACCAMCSRGPSQGYVTISLVKCVFLAYSMPKFFSPFSTWTSYPASRKNWAISSFWWCPSIAWMKERQHDAGRLLIKSVNQSQMVLSTRQGVEQTDGYGRQG
jgi:hypothetical protein